MRILIMVLVGLASTLNTMAQSKPPSVGGRGSDTNAPGHAAPPSTGGHGSETNAPDQTVNGYTLDDKHALEPGDQLFFQIVEGKKQPVSLSVTDSGEINVPYLGRVSVAGKTCRTMAAELKTMLEKDYYYRVTVIIGLDVVNKTTKVSGRVLVWGEVRNQGSIDIMAGHPMTISEAILRSGGLTDSADKKKIQVIRKDDHGSRKVIYVNLAEVMDKGKTDKDIAVEPDDYIIVGSRLIRF